MTEPATSDDRGTTRFALLLLLVYAALLAINLSAHELWRDEWRAWVLARYSTSPGDLWYNLRHELSPALWHYLLFGLTRLTHDATAMQGLHFVFAAAAAWLFVRHAPFPRLHKALFIVGYYWLYEYATISRPYVMGVVLTFAFCLAARRRQRSYLPAAACLALLCQVSSHALLIAFALSAGLVLEPLLDPERRRARRLWTADVALALILVLAGAGLSVLQIMRPETADLQTAGQEASSEAPARRHDFARDIDAPVGLPVPPSKIEALATVARGYAPLPAPVLRFWNTHLLEGLAFGPPLLAGLGVALLAAALALVWRQPAARVTLATGSLLLIGFATTRFAGYARHHGSHFLLLVACAWLALDAGRAEGRWRRHLLAVLFALQAVAGLYASVVDWRQPFSASKATVAWLRANGLGDAEIVADVDYATSSIGGCLGRPIYYPSHRAHRGFLVWDRNRRGHGGTDTLQQAARLRQESGREVIVVTNYLLDLRSWRPEMLQAMALEQLASFPKSIEKEERYIVYRLRAESSRPVAPQPSP